ncbi:hypothetical protein [Nocardia lasii]|uniref:Secreted protein n=1 Tax=Nocardia lasii TaxID=1616107 RepID=A0ABW1JQH5_9NOCA
MSGIRLFGVAAAAVVSVAMLGAGAASAETTPTGSADLSALTSGTADTPESVSYPPQVYTGSGEAFDTLLEQLYVIFFPAKPPTGN